jgi:hypothetical protein
LSLSTASSLLDGGGAPGATMLASGIGVKGEL